VSHQNTGRRRPLLLSGSHLPDILLPHSSPPWLDRSIQVRGSFLHQIFIS
jgi:hypothetical protein